MLLVVSVAIQPQPVPGRVLRTCFANSVNTAAVYILGLVF